jgi:hypothetical protein
VIFVVVIVVVVVADFDNRTIEISINGKENNEINCKRLE